MRQIATLISFLSLSQAASLLSAAEPATMQDAIIAIAKEVALQLNGVNPQRLIAVDPILAAPPLAAGPRIASDLEKALREQGLQISSTAPFRVSGQFSRGRGIEERLSGVLKISVVDSQSFEIASFNKEGFLDTETAAALLGPTAELNPKDNGRLQVKTIQASLAKRQAVVLPQRPEVRASEGSLYGLEVCGEQGNALPITILDGQAFVDLQRGQRFSLKLSNHDEAYDAAAKITIDGLSVFAFSENNFDHFIIPAGKNFHLEGWHKNNSDARQFVVSSYENSAAAQASAEQSRIGSITVAFAPAWAPGQAPPESEVGRVHRGQGNAIGLGPQVGQQLRTVQRHVGRIRSIVTIRYDR